jgi:hypothetical protein
VWNKFVEWQRVNDTQIRWFFIGVFTVLFLRDGAEGKWFEAMLDLIFIGVNFWLSNNDR